jgi:hypothetical protein
MTWYAKLILWIKAWAARRALAWAKRKVKEYETPRDEDRR